MAEAFLHNKLYEYGANSNLVLEADRGGRRRVDEPKGEVETLRGRTNKIKMGDRVAQGREKPEIEIANSKRQKMEPLEKEKIVEAHITTRSNKNILMVDDIDSSTYRPKSRITRQVYEELLVEIQGILGDQPNDVLKSAVNEVLSILKDEGVNPSIKQKDISNLLPNFTSDHYQSLARLGNKITDFKSATKSEEQEDRPMEEEMAVVFEDEERMNFEDDEDEEEENEAEVEEVEDNNRKELKGAKDFDETDEVDENNLSAHDIDAYWLQRQLSKYFSDANASARIAEEILQILNLPDERQCENRLVVLLDFEKFSLIKLLLNNRFKIYYCIKLKQTQSDTDRAKVEQEMIADIDNGGHLLFQELQEKASAENWAQDRLGELASKARREAMALAKSTEAEDVQGNNKEKHFGGVIAGMQFNNHLKLDDFTFTEGSHLMTNTRCELPEKSWRAQKKGYEEVHVPAMKPIIAPEDQLKAIHTLDEWMQPAFKGINTLNRIQSKLAPFALNDLRNMLLCAPTGSGKTNVALLTMLGTMARHMKENGTLNLSEFKIVYIAPMKALVQECVQSFSKRLESFGMNVRELSGDQSLSQAQLSDTHLIVTTPEKWDIVTRKAGEKTFTQLVRLIIIDEIHLLHDDRGPVLETLVARILRYTEGTQQTIRLVGLSATLPNYQDVAAFLRVDPKEGLFYFDSSYRPVPLQQQFIGVTERKALKRHQLMNEICYEKCLLHAGKNQVLIFTQSRSDTMKTARALLDMALTNDTLMKFLKEDSASYEILKIESENAKNTDLKSLLANGFAFHHAGLSRSDRTLVEDLFADKHIQVLVSTATLAWGVNLPCHTVIIKGTQMYSPELGCWTELSPLDILQMIGRAGRYGLDSEGEGIIITNHSELQYYLSLMNQQLPIESQFIKKLPDYLNAEVVLGTITTIQEAATWLGYTYLYVRMLRNPKLYGIADLAADPELYTRRIELIHAAANILEKHDLMKYDRRSGTFQATELGRIASYYYVSSESIATYKDTLRPNMNEIELFRLFSGSSEFKHISIRDEEKLELSKLLSRVPIPIKESVEEPSAKVNALLQAYISRLKLEGFAIAADMIFIQQSACRLMRALFEIALSKGWSTLSMKILELCCMVERRLWRSQSPLRQFTNLPDLLLRKLEKITDISWEKYISLKPQDFGEMVKVPKMGKTIYKFVHMIPKLHTTVHAYPITRSLLHIDIKVMSDFEHNESIHGPQVMFWLLVEDGDGNKILHYEPLVIKTRQATWEQSIEMNVTLLEPLPPQYFLRLVADRWLHASAVFPISFRHLLLPEKTLLPTEVLDLNLLPIASDPVLQAYFPGHIRYLNPIQTQSFYSFYNTDESIFLCAPHGAGKTLCAEIAILRHLREHPEEKIMYIAPKEETCEYLYSTWKQSFRQVFPEVEIGLLTGDMSLDLLQVKQCQILLATPEIWDITSRKWKSKKIIHEITLYIFDDLHYLGTNATSSATYEVIISRARFMSSQLLAHHTYRFIGLSHSILNAKDVADWLGVHRNMTYNFATDARPYQIDYQIQTFEHSEQTQRLAMMTKSAFHQMVHHSNGKPTLLFVPSRKQAQVSAIDFLSFAMNRPGFVYGKADVRYLQSLDYSLLQQQGEVEEATLIDLMKQAGIAYLHEGLSSQGIAWIQSLFTTQVIGVLLVPYTMVHHLTIHPSHVLVLDTVSYDGHTDCYQDLNTYDFLKMIGVAACQSITESDESSLTLQTSHQTSHQTSLTSGSKVSRCMIFTHYPKRARIRRALYESIMLESYLDHDLHNHLIGELVNRTIETKSDAVDYLTWTLYYRRLLLNPNYYGLSGNTNRHVSDSLSELIEDTITDLESSKMVTIEEEMNIIPLNLAMIAAYYDISYATIDMISSTITEKTKLRGVLDILTAASEFTTGMTIRYGEVYQLQQLVTQVLAKQKTGLVLENTTKDSLVTQKPLILFHAYVARVAYTQELAYDMKWMVKKAITLLHAMVDVVASQGWLKPALAAMEMTQYLVQGIWEKDSVLTQIPYFDETLIRRLHQADPPIETVFDVIEMDEVLRAEYFAFPVHQLNAIAQFCNAYPMVEVTYTLSFAEDGEGGGGGEVSGGDAITVHVLLRREMDEEEEQDAVVEGLGVVYSGSYPGKKMENWWVIIADTKKNILYSIKRLSISTETKVKLEFFAPEEVGEYKLSVLLMCDSYLGCDQEYDFDMRVV